MFIKINKKAPINIFKSNKLRKMKIFAKKPEKGGIPEIEKKIITKDNAVNLFTFDKPAKFEIKNVCGILRKNFLK